MFRPSHLTLLAAVVSVAAGCPSAGSRDAAPGPGEMRFTDVSATSGITLIGVSGGRAKHSVVSSLGQGAAALDYDGDGRLDLFIANGDVFPGTPLPADPSPALYRNLGDLRFENVTAAAGLDFDGWAHGVSRVDFDGDSHPDLYITIFGGANRFYRNRGDGTFEDASDRWGAKDPGPSTAAVFFDADADGDLDLYVGNYVHYDPLDPPNGGELCEWRGLHVFCGPRGTVAAADSFWENREGRLVDATVAFGFAEVRPSYTLGAVAGDVDGDGDQDVYVANDSEPNYLFENIGGGRFLERASHFGVGRNQDGRPQAGMGVEFGDVDQNGLFDLFVTNFSHDSNTLYLNQRTADGRTFFLDGTSQTKLGMSSFRNLSWGARIVDLDLDGWPDIVSVSGHVYPQVEGASVGTSYAQPNQVMRNLGRGATGGVSFEPFRPKDGDAFLQSKVSRGLVAADLDDDGDLDLLVVEVESVPTLIRNDTARRGDWIGFRLGGRAPNVDALGARLVVEDAQGRERWREQTGGGSYLSTGDVRLHVGLGPGGGPIRAVTVRWPDGQSTTHPGLEANRYWFLDAASGRAHEM
jgi:hypothetical protein